jgi:hypothetical protein
METEDFTGKKLQTVMSIRLPNIGKPYSHIAGIFI